MFLDEVSRFSFLRILTVRQIFPSLKSLLKLFPAPTQIFQNPLWMWTVGLNAVVWCYSCFVLLIPPPHAYWIVSKDHICSLEYSITHMVVTCHTSDLFKVTEFQVLAAHVKISHTTLSSSVFWPCIWLCGNLCWLWGSISPNKSGGST